MDRRGARVRDPARPPRPRCGRAGRHAAVAAPLRRPAGVREVLGKVGRLRRRLRAGALRRRHRPAGAHQERAPRPPTTRRAAPDRLRRRPLPRAAQRALHQPARARRRPSAAHVVEQYLSLLAPLGIAPGPPEFHVPVPAAADRRMEELLVEHGVKRSRPPGRDQPRRGPRGQALAGRQSHARSPSGSPPRRARGSSCSGARTRRTWRARSATGSPRARDARAAHRPRRAGGACCAAPPLMIANDTGPLHLAAALGTPCLGLFGPTRAERNGPYGPRCRGAAESRRHDGRASSRARCSRRRSRCSTRAERPRDPPHRHHHRVERGGAAARLPRERGLGGRDRGDRRRVHRQDRVQLAREFTDRVWVRPWPGFAVQKNFAIEQATGEWILSLDADERVTPELARAHPGHRRRGRARPTATPSRAGTSSGAPGCATAASIPTISFGCSAGGRGASWRTPSTSR